MDKDIVSCSSRANVDCNHMPKEQVGCFDFTCIKETFDQCINHYLIRTAANFLHLPDQILGNVESILFDGVLHGTAEMPDIWIKPKDRLCLAEEIKNDLHEACPPISLNQHGKPFRCHLKIGLPGCQQNCDKPLESLLFLGPDAEQGTDNRIVRGEGRVASDRPNEDSEGFLGLRNLTEEEAKVRGSEGNLGLIKGRLDGQGDGSVANYGASFFNFCRELRLGRKKG